MICSLYCALAETEAVPGNVAVLGCWPGRTSAWMGMILSMLGSKRSLELYDAFPRTPIHPDDVMPDREQPCDHDAGILTCEGNFEAFGVSTVRHYHPGWFQQTLKNLALSSFIYVDVQNRESLWALVGEVYDKLEDKAICIYEGYGLGLTACVQRTLDAFMRLRPNEPVELAVSGITGGFVRKVPEWLKKERADAVVLAAPPAKELLL
jgi:hypothetical protein